MESPATRSALAPLLTTDEVATIFGCTPQWLSKLRAERAGPRFVRLGALVRYRVDDVEHWLDQNCVVTAAGSPAVPVSPAKRADIASRVTPDSAVA